MWLQSGILRPSLGLLCGMLAGSPSFAGMGPILQVTPGLYTAQRDDGENFIMERVDAGYGASENRWAFWRTFTNEELVRERDYVHKYQDADSRLRGQLPVNPGEGSQNYLDDIVAFDESLFRRSSAHELWVAYATPRAITRAEDAESDAIEMYLAVATAEGAPMVTHMGLCPGFHYLARMVDDPGNPACRPHRGLDLALHAFAARVTLLRDPSKLYMITALPPEERESLVRRLPGDAFAGSSLTLAIARFEEQNAKAPSDEMKELAARREAVSRERKHLDEQVSRLTADTNRIDDTEAWDSYRKAASEGRLTDLRVTASDLLKSELDLVSLIRARQDQEVSRIAAALPLTSAMTPIAATRIPFEIRILSRNRQETVFHYRRESRSIVVGGRTLTGEATRKYEWFFHPHLRLPSLLTVNLDALAALPSP